MDGARVLEADLSASQMISLLSGDDVSKGIISHHRLYNDERSCRRILSGLFDFNVAYACSHFPYRAKCHRRENNTLSQIIVTGVDMRLYLGVKVLFYSLVVIIELFLCLAVDTSFWRDYRFKSGPIDFGNIYIHIPSVVHRSFIASIARNDVRRYI